VWAKVETLPLALLRRVLMPAPDRRFTIQQIKVNTEVCRYLSIGTVNYYIGLLCAIVNCFVSSCFYADVCFLL
jgi:hypothetical protein